MFSKYVLFKKGHLNKRAGVWTPWTPPGSATDPLVYETLTVPVRRPIIMQPIFARHQCRGAG